MKKGKFWMFGRQKKVRIVSVDGNALVTADVLGRWAEGPENRAGNRCRKATRMPSGVDFLNIYNFPHPCFLTRKNCCWFNNKGNFNINIIHKVVNYLCLNTHAGGGAYITFSKKMIVGGGGHN